MQIQLEKRLELIHSVRDHLLKQEFVSVNEHSICAYRGIFGRKCAIGFLIKNKYYNSNLENQTVNSSDVYDALSASIGIQYDSEDELFFTEMQMLHDNINEHDPKETIKEKIIIGFNQLEEEIKIRCA